MKTLITSSLLTLLSVFSIAGGTMLTKPPVTCAVSITCWAQYIDDEGRVRWLSAGRISCSGENCHTSATWIECDNQRTDCMRGS